MSNRKGERHLDTPTSTRSYRSKTRMRLQEILDVHKMMDILGPDEEEYQTVLMAAATIDAVNRRSGAYGDPPFPAPINFVEHLFGYDDEDEPVWDDPEDRKRSTLMLRCIHKMSEYMQEHLPDDMSGEVNLVCPMCGSDSIDVTIGPTPKVENGKVLHGEGEDGILSMTVLCDCEPFSIEDVELFEDMVNEVISQQG